jgi:hypothetical protein
MSNSNFERANVTVQLSTTGDVPTATSEKMVTPPEMMILRGIHGKDCIRNIRLIKENNNGKLKDWDSEKSEEFHRLVSFYGIGKLRDLWPNINEDADHFKPNFEDYGVTQKHIDASLRGVGALDKVEITEGLIKDVIKSKKMTVDDVVDVVNTMTRADKDTIFRALNKKSDAKALSDFNTETKKLEDEKIEL